MLRIRRDGERKEEEIAEGLLGCTWVPTRWLSVAAAATVFHSEQTEQGRRDRGKDPKDRATLELHRPAIYMPRVMEVGITGRE